ncbi:MAG: site-2 protease family protein, partial [Planctomycetes bacterium]|nr:site-2 protease family protein [Planctomycetota bacterium]
SGARILKVNEQAVSTWRDLIRQFREYAGGPVDLTYLDLDGGTHVVPFHVPHSLRTLLGIGPEARIVSVDGTTSVEIETGRGMETVHVAYHEGLRSLLSDLVGKKHVAVGLRPTVLSPIETRYIDVTEDMVDPWVGRIAFRPNIDVAREMRILKGKNVLDAVRIGIHKTYYFILQVYTTIERMVVSRTVGVENLSGPLGIVSIGGQIARAGFVEFLFFMAIISANLAVINFLPLPIVDGGLMVFLIIEKIKGSPVSLRVQVATQMIGLFLIIGAFIFVTYNDALRMWG